MDKGDELPSPSPQRTLQVTKESVSERGTCLRGKALGRIPGGSLLHRLWEVRRLNGEKPTEREKGRRTVDVQPLTMQRKTLVCHLPFKRSPLTALGDPHKQKPHPRPLRSPLCSGVLKAEHSQCHETWARRTGAVW